MLPENKPTTFDKTPTKFFVWGASMTGKTYFARHFPNPILLNTDGNYVKVDTPSVYIKDFEHFCKVIDELEKGDHAFETIIIDLIDDIELMVTKYICAKNSTPKVKIEALADLGYGKGFSMHNSIWKNLMMKLSTLPYNVIFISHLTEYVEDKNTIKVPSLPAKQLNSCLGRCDLQIQCIKFGNTYQKVVTSQRDTYKKEDIKNEKLLKLLSSITGLLK